MHTEGVHVGPPGLRSLFDTLEPRNPGRGVGAFGGLPGLADALGVERTGPGAAGLGGLPGVLDAVALSAAAAEATQSTLTVLSVELTISITQATGVSVPAEDSLELGAGADAQAAGDAIVAFATGLFDAFAAQNAELSEEEALAAFETLVRDAIDAGFTEALTVLEGQGQLTAETEQFTADIRAAVEAGLTAFFGGTVATSATATEAPLPTAESFGITSFEQVSLSVSLQVAQARIAFRGTEALGEPATDPQPVDLLDTRSFDDFTTELFAFADSLFDRLVGGEDVFGDGGLQALVDQVLAIFGAGFDDAFNIFDDFGAALLSDGTPVQSVFEAAFQSVELHITQTRIETADGLVIEQTSVSLRVIQVQIQVAVAADLGGEVNGDLPPPETPEDIAQNIFDFASELFGLFRAQNSDLDDEQALADFVALTRDAAVRGANEALTLLDALGELDDEQETDVQAVLSALDALLADAFPQVADLLA